MIDYRSLNHTRWECKYHVVFIPKCRRKVLFGKVRHTLGSIFHELAKQRESEIVEGHLLPDYVQHADTDSSKVFRIGCGWVHQGEEC